MVTMPPHTRRNEKNTTFHLFFKQILKEQCKAINDKEFLRKSLEDSLEISQNNEDRWM